MHNRMWMIKRAVKTIRLEYEHFLAEDDQRDYYRSIDMASALLYLEIIDVDKYLLLYDIVYRLYS